MSEPAPGAEPAPARTGAIEPARPVASAAQAAARATGAREGSMAEPRGTAVQRARVVGLRGLSWIACRLPERPAVALADIVG